MRQALALCTYEVPTFRCDFMYFSSLILILVSAHPPSFLSLSLVRSLILVPCYFTASEPTLTNLTGFFMTLIRLYLFLRQKNDMKKHAYSHARMYTDTHHFLFCSVNADELRRTVSLVYFMFFSSSYS